MSVQTTLEAVTENLIPLKSTAVFAVASHKPADSLPDSAIPKKVKGGF